MGDYVKGVGRIGRHPKSEVRQEPRNAHVLDLHDIEAVAGALIAAARADIAHEQSQCGGRIGSCIRGGHLCAVCYKPIWDCGRTFLAGLADALADYDATHLNEVLEAADRAGQEN